MSDLIEADICVIGGGSAGLSVAAGASQMGAKTVLVEAEKMGGDCLNFGCVPSKALIAAGHVAQAFRTADKFGINSQEPHVDFSAARDHVAGVIAAIAPTDSPERFRGLGVEVILERAKFTGPREIEAGNKVVRARRFVIATGSSPSAPPIEGLKSVPFFTNETIFDNDKNLDHLIVIGGGPIGCEMAQAHRRMGCRVTVLEAFAILGKDDPEATAIVKRRLASEGISLREGIEIKSVATSDGQIKIEIIDGGVAETVSGSHLLVAAGRRPNLGGLNLEAANVSYTAKGIDVDGRLRTSNRRIFAIGDVAGGPQFTHVASYHAGVVIRNALFRLPAKVDYSALPWVTYTDPELAHVGLTEAQAIENGENIHVLRWAYAENDRAQTERETEGFVKAIVTSRGGILGATIVGTHAGELIQPWVLAIGKKLKIGAMANMIAPYPTRGEISKRAAGSFFAPKLFSERTKKVVRFLARFG